MKIEQVWPELTTEKVIGKGSYGTVYKCFREVNGEKTYSAVKVISIPQQDEEYYSFNTEGMTIEQTKEYYRDIVDDFTSEIKILESLKGNKNIVEIRNYHVVEKEESIGWHIFIEMELLTGFNSYSSDKTFTEEEVIKIGIDLCNALIACNEKNIIHRDIKPENIFVSDSGDFKLGDFGVSRQMEKTYASMSRKGTFNYMAPEVFYSRKYDSRADIYSLGIVMYQLLNNNRTPFLDPEKQLVRYSERQAAFDKRINGEPIPHLKDVSSELDTIILKACEYKAENRYTNAANLKKALEKKKLSGASGWFYKHKKAFLITVSSLIAVALLVSAIAVCNELFGYYPSTVYSGEEYYIDPWDDQFYLYANETGIYYFDKGDGSVSQWCDKKATGMACESSGEKTCFISDDNTAIYMFDKKDENPEQIYADSEAEFFSVIYFDKKQVLVTCRDITDGIDIYSLMLIDIKSGENKKVAQLGDDEYVVCVDSQIFYLEKAQQGQNNCVMYIYDVASKINKKIASDVYACKDFFRASTDENTYVSIYQYLSKNNGTLLIKEIENIYDETININVTHEIENCEKIIYWDNNNLFFTDGNFISRYNLFDKSITIIDANFDEVSLINSQYYFFDSIGNEYRLNRITDEGNIKAVKYTDKIMGDFDVVFIDQNSFILWDKEAKEMKLKKLYDIDPLLVEPTEEDWKNFEDFSIPGFGMHNLMFGLNFKSYDHKKVDSKSFLLNNILTSTGRSMLYDGYFDDETMFQYADKKDPRNRFRSDPERSPIDYSRYSEENLKWLIENIYNVDYEQTDDFNYKDGEYRYSFNEGEEPYFHDGYFYCRSSELYGSGGDPRNFDTKIRNKTYNADGTITVNADTLDYFGDEKTGSFIIKVGLKEIDGKRYWSVYELSVDLSMRDINELSYFEKKDQTTFPNSNKNTYDLTRTEDDATVGMAVEVSGQYNEILAGEKDEIAFLTLSYYDDEDRVFKEVEYRYYVNGTEITTINYIWNEDTYEMVEKNRSSKYYKSIHKTFYSLDLGEKAAIFNFYFDNLVPNNEISAEENVTCYFEIMDEVLYNSDFDFKNERYQESFFIN